MYVANTFFSNFGTSILRRFKCKQEAVFMTQIMWLDFSFLRFVTISHQDDTDEVGTMVNTLTWLQEIL